MSIQLSIASSSDELAKKIAGVPNDTIGDINKLVAKAALDISNNAKRRVAKGPKTGSTYTWQVALPGERNAFPITIQGNTFFARKRIKAHVASASGESPASDTGFLVNSIISDDSNLKAEAGSVAKYATWLEEGTRFMDARPFLQPAVDEVWPEALTAIGGVIERALEA